MRTVDRTRMRAPIERVLAAAVDVERWPALLPHYRRVRMLERQTDGGLVEMAAWRPFGPFNYPTWWVSEMRVDRAAPAVHFPVALVLVQVAHRAAQVARVPALPAWCNLR